MYKVLNRISYCSNEVNSYMQKSALSAEHVFLSTSTAGQLENFTAILSLQNQAAGTKPVVHGHDTGRGFESSRS